MDRIEKIINIDNSRSHRNGLLPFVHYGNGIIENVTAINPNGNFGNYVCDFCIFSGDGETKIEIDRLKYLDVIRRYRFVRNSLLNGVLVKKVVVTNKDVSKIDCGDGVASDASIEYSSAVTTKFIVDFTEKNEQEEGKFPQVLTDYFPLKLEWFTFSDGYFIYEKPTEYFLIMEKIKNQEPLSLEEQKLLGDVNRIDIEINAEENKYFVLIPNYDDVISFNDMWKNWWDDNLGEGWENQVFDSYEEYTGNNYLKFYDDINKYVIGEIEVPQKYSGEKVPNYVYYISMYEQQNWFVENSAITETAYSAPSNSNKSIIYEWEARGGGDFYDFISKITPKWQKYKTITIGDKIFQYGVPQIEINALINSEMEFETLYNVYEYSAKNNSFEGAVTAYSAYPSTSITYIQYAFNADTQKREYVNRYYLNDTFTYNSENDVYTITSESIPVNGLTKQWHSFSGDTTSAFCESMLSTLVHPSSLMVSDKIFGKYKVFDEKNPEVGQMFKCTFFSGSSLIPDTEYFYSGKTTYYENLYDEDGNVNGEKIKITTRTGKTKVDSCEEVAPQSTGYQVFSTKKIGVSSGTIYNSSNPVVEENETSDGREVIEKNYWSSVTWTKYSWWECEKITGNTKNILCADGENVSPNDNTKYRNVTIVSCVENMVGRCEFGNYFYALARFDNGNTEMGGKEITAIGDIKPLEIPYVVDEKLNIVSYDNGDTVYDKVTKIEYDEESSIVTIKYAKGITSGDTEEESGVHYADKMSYEKGKRAIVPIDGVYMSEIYYDYIDTNSNKMEVYSEEYKLYRMANVSQITGMEICTQWTEDGAVNAMLITKEGSEGLQEEPKYELSLMYNRGNAAAWENHFKLSECNTLEDLENYGNNFFNI